MKLIRPNVEIIEQAQGFDGIYEAIAQAASTCYKSGAKTGKYARTFVGYLIKQQHNAMLEFGTVYLKIPIEDWNIDFHEWELIFPSDLPWIRFGCDGKFMCITTNLRHIVEHSIGSNITTKYLVVPESLHEKRYTVKFTTSIGVAREFTRHRAFSFAQESTRYCNYSKDKFGNELTFILPSWEKLSEEDANMVPRFIAMGLKMNEKGEKARPFYTSLIVAEASYLEMIKNEHTAQQAREVLPLCTKSELCMCGFESDWKHFFDLRLRGTTGAPHPDAKYCAELLHNKFKEKGINL